MELDPDDVEHGLDNLDTFISEGQRLRVYLACSLTSTMNKELRDQLLADAEAALRENGFHVYNPCRYTNRGSPHSNEEVAAIDQIEAMTADLIFFIRIQPSIGVGIECQIAADLLVPWLDAKPHNEFAKVTPLLHGLPNLATGAGLIINIDDLNKFKTDLAERLQAEPFQDYLRDVSRAKSAATQTIQEFRLGWHLRRQRLLLNMSVRELAARVDLALWWIESIERDADLAACLTFMQLVRLISETRLTFVNTDDNGRGAAFPRLAAIDDFPADLVHAANKFATYSLRIRLRGEPLPEPDDVMLRHWREWLPTEFQKRPAHYDEQKLTRPQHLKCHIILPHSHLSSEELEKRDAVVEAIKQASNNLRAFSCEIVLPDFDGWKTSREERASEIYLEAVPRLHDCDFAIVITTPAATGVGIMTRLLANSTLPCLALKERGEDVSRLFHGMYCRQLAPILEYSRPSDIEHELGVLLDQQAPVLLESAARRRAAMQRIDASQVSRAVDRVRIPLQQGRAEAVAQFKSSVRFVREEWLEKLASEKRILYAATLLQFVHIAKELKWGVAASDSGVPSLQPSEPLMDASEWQQLNPAQQHASIRSLENLISALNSIENPQNSRQKTLFAPDPETVTKAWSTYCHELAPSAADYEQERLIRTVGEWLDVLQDSGNL